MIKWLPFLLLFPVGTASAVHSCVGKVTAVDVGAPANVQVGISGIGHGNYLCSASERVGPFSPEGCRAVMATLLAAQTSGKSVRLYFNNDTNSSCAKGDWRELHKPEFGFYYLSMEG